MALKKVNYIDDETLITAENLNDIQDSIISLESKSKEVDNTLLEIEDNMKNTSTVDTSRYNMMYVKDGRLVCNTTNHPYDETTGEGDTKTAKYMGIDLGGTAVTAEINFGFTGEIEDPDRDTASVMLITSDLGRSRTAHIVKGAIHFGVTPTTVALGFYNVDIIETSAEWESKTDQDIYKYYYIAEEDKFYVYNNEWGDAKCNTTYASFNDWLTARNANELNTEEVYYTPDHYVYIYDSVKSKWNPQSCYEFETYTEFTNYHKKNRRRFYYIKKETDSSTEDYSHCVWFKKNGGTWGVPDDAQTLDNLSESPYKFVTPLELNKIYKLKWFNTEQSGKPIVRILLPAPVEYRDTLGNTQTTNIIDLLDSTFITDKTLFDSKNGRYCILEHFYENDSKVRGFYTGVRVVSTDSEGTDHYYRHDFEHQANDGMLFNAPTGHNYILFSNDIYDGTKLDYI